MKPFEEKAVERVLEGNRVTVTYMGENGEVGQGVVDGDTDTYQTSFSPSGYVCTCKAGQNHRVCWHARALELEVHRRLERVAV